MDAEEYTIGPNLIELPTWPSHVQSVRKLLPLSKDHPEVNVSILLSVAASVEGFIKSVIVETDKLLSISSRTAIDRRVREDFISKVLKANWSQTIDNYKIFFGVPLDYHSIPIELLQSEQLMTDNAKGTLSRKYFRPISSLFHLRNIIAHGQQIELSEGVIVKSTKDGYTEISEFLDLSTRNELGQYLTSNNLLKSIDGKSIDHSILHSEIIVEHFKVAVSNFFDRITGKVFLYLKHCEQADLRLMEQNPSLPNYEQAIRLKRLLFATDGYFDLDVDWAYNYE